MGKHPMAILSGNDKLTIDEKGKKTVVEGKLLDSVRDYMKGFKIETDLDLCYTGGAVGGVGYDIIRQYENIPDTNKEVVGTPTVHLMVFDEFIAYDHLHDKIILVALAEKEEYATPVLDRMEREIKTSVPEGTLCTSAY